jgi:hypothetical protein
MSSPRNEAGEEASGDGAGGGGGGGGHALAGGGALVGLSSVRGAGSDAAPLMGVIVVPDAIKPLNLR